MTVTTNEHGQQNIWAREPQMTVMEVSETQGERAEKANGRWAMVGILGAFISYAFTGNIIPGVW